MDILQALILGIIQGLTEFIPVSSSGHLTLVSYLMGWEPTSQVFDIAAHTGTLIALLIYFRARIGKYAKSLIKIRDNKLAAERKVVGYVVAATVPAAIIAILVRDVVEQLYNSNDSDQSYAALLTSAALIIVGIFFILSDNITIKKQIAKISDVGYMRAIIIGFAQAAALFRGVSRSGATILTGKILRIKIVDAAEFSFLMSIPILMMSTAYGIWNLISGESGLNLVAELPIIATGMIAAAISGLFAVSYMLRYLRTKGLSAFGWYRIALGLFVVWLTVS